MFLDFLNIISPYPIEILPSGKVTLSPLEKYQRVTIVIGPSLPINIIIIERIFEAAESEVVIPVVKPTVPYADTTSNSISLSSNWGSKIEIKNVPIKT